MFFFSLRHETEYSAPSGSILGPLLFNINGIDLFFEFENNHIASSADDTKPLLIQATLILQSLKNCLHPRHLSLVWKNHLKAYTEKCHLLLSSKTLIETTATMGALTKSSKIKMVTRFSIDWELNFGNHISHICRKVSRTPCD